MQQTIPKSRKIIRRVLYNCTEFNVSVCPASSVQSEREKSKAKYVITDVRNRLSSKTVQASLCLKSWNSVLKIATANAITLE